MLRNTQTDLPLICLESGWYPLGFPLLLGFHSLLLACNCISPQTEPASSRGNQQRAPHPLGCDLATHPCFSSPFAFTLDSDRRETSDTLQFIATYTGFVVGCGWFTCNMCRSLIVACLSIVGKGHQRDTSRFVGSISHAETSPTICLIESAYLFVPKVPQLCRKRDDHRCPFEVCLQIDRTV